MTSTGFYRAFEERHRGPRDLIKQRLVAYLPFISPLLQLYEPAAALDLGCGRGEWLELLQEKEFLPHGVDLDEGMLEACKARGLPATQGDAIAYLKSLADATQCIVSGFHIVEHIPFDDLETLVIEALRVLKPGGLFILETPNPENIVVGTSNFYLDPTHLRPIPPLLLAFLPEQYGYERVKILRLQESPDLATRNDIGLIDVLGGVSPDYAVVAQKAAEPETLELFNAAFDTRYGIELYDLASRYDEKVSQRMAALDQRMVNAELQTGGMTDALARIIALQERLIKTTAQAARSAARLEQLHDQCRRTEQHAEAAESRATEAESRATEAETRATEAESRAAEAELHTTEAELRASEAESRASEAESRAQEQQQRIDETGGNSHYWWQQACALETERNALRQSWSWRITAPVRFVGSVPIHAIPRLRNAINHPAHLSINVLQRPLAMMMRVVLRRPGLSCRLNQRLLRYPVLHQQLLGVARSQGAMPGVSTYVPPCPPSTMSGTEALDHLTPHARQIYRDFKTAIERRQKESG